MIFQPLNMITGGCLYPLLHGTSKSSPSSIDWSIRKGVIEEGGITVIVFEGEVDRTTFNPFCVGNSLHTTYIFVSPVG